MAKNLYKSAFAIGSSQGKYTASMYDVASSENKIKLEDMRFQFEQESFDRKIGAISDTLSLASTVVGRAEDISKDVSLLEGEYGDMEKPKGIFRKMMQSTKMGLGLGEYKFGDEIISAKDIAVKSSEVKYKNMFDEAVSNFDYKSKVNKVQMLEEDIVSDQKLKILDFEKDSNKDSNKINFNEPYTMSLIK
tara:strand:+ start:4720 stop:5292 length:573 start_codon:yes stop_codon:yes gene_type:complete